MIDRINSNQFERLGVDWHTLHAEFLRESGSFEVISAIYFFDDDGRTEVKATNARNACVIESRAIKEIIMERDHTRIMFLRLDDGVVDGVFKTDGYIDGRKINPENIARFIQERVELLK